MHKLSIFLVLLLVLSLGIFSGCSGDDGSEEDYAGYQVTGAIEVVENSAPIEGQLNLSKKNLEMIISLNLQKKTVIHWRR